VGPNSQSITKFDCHADFVIDSVKTHLYTKSFSGLSFGLNSI